MNSLKTKSLIVLASTFPRWENDKVPGFVLDHARNMSLFFKDVIVIAPHYEGAKRHEQIDNNIYVKRFRYFYPARQQNIAYGEFRNNVYNNSKSIFYVIAQLWTTLVVCRKNKAHIINAHWLVPQGFVAVLIKKLLGSKVVVSVHGGDVFTLNGRIMRAIKSFVLRNADRVVVNSSATYDACNSLYQEREYKIIPEIVDVNKFSEARKQPKKYEKDRLSILFVGRLAPEKGAIYLCEAVAKLTKAKKNVVLTIVGDGSEKVKIQEFIEDNKLQNAIRLEGWKQREELVKYYAAADVFVGPSIKHSNGWIEAFGIVLAEASSAGIPVITTNKGGMKDIIQDGKSGFIIEDKNSDQLADKLKLLLDKPELRKKMGMYGAEFVKANFEKTKIGDMFLHVIEDLR